MYSQSDIDQFEYRGIVYCPHDEVEPEENIKRYHNIYTYHDEIKCHIGSVPLSPYLELTEARFIRWIQAGRPTRDKMGGHHNNHHDKYWKKLYDEGLDKILLGDNGEL